MGSSPSDIKQDGIDIFDKNKQQEQGFAKTLFHNLLQNIKRQPLVESVSYSQFQAMLKQSKGDIQHFFTLIEERISDIYITLSKNTLQYMSEKKMSNTESKIFISQQILSTSINILKVLGEQDNFKYIQKNVNRLNDLQISILSYMKAKYPRQSQNFVPGQLMQLFKNFDFVQQPQNDVLKILNISFDDQNYKKINIKLKKFFNQIISQLDENYPLFEKIMLEKIFVVNKQGKYYTVRNRISRKIPQNIQKFAQNDSTIDLKSPELFRLIYNWVKDMSDYLLDPDDELKQKDHFKTINYSEKGMIFDYISVDQIENQISTLRYIFLQLKSQYEAQMEELKQHLQLFNHNLIRALHKAERRQKYVPKKEVQIIKYAMCNRRLLSWILIEKLMIVIKKLIKASKDFQPQIGMRIDLIKFNVPDMMRSQVTGNMYQLKKVFNNMLELQKKDELKILKITNRLESPLKDCKIIFKITKSYLFCQLQLILSDGNQFQTDKLKSIQVLNTFFLDIQKSPYGVMAELSSLLSSKDNKINYQQQISFQKCKQLNMQSCQNQHPLKISRFTSQKKPFICSLCTQFYGSYQNIFIYKYCQVCNSYLCAKCLIQQGQQSQVQLRKQTVRKLIKEQLNRIAQQQLLQAQSAPQGNSDSKLYANSSYYCQRIQNFMNINNLTSLRQIKKKGNKISYKQIQKYLRSQIPQQKLLQNTNTFYFLIFKFVAGKLKITSMRYHPINGIKKCFVFGYDESLKQISFNYFDFITSLHQSTFTIKSEIVDQLNIQLFENMQIPKKIDLNKMTLIVTQFQLNLDKNNSELNLKVIMNATFQTVKQRKKQYSYQQVNKKQFAYSSIQSMRSTLPDLLQTHQVYELSGQGIEDEHLVYFSNITWKKDVKILNLCNNKIKSIDVLLENLFNLQKIIISKNFIEKVNFKTKLESLKKFIAPQNKIQQLNGIQNIQNIVQLNLYSNHIFLFQFQRKLQKLRILNLKYNSIKKIFSISKSTYPKLVGLYFSGLQNNYNEKDQSLKPEHIIFDLPNLTTIELEMVSMQSLDISNCPNLQLIQFNNLRCEHLRVPEFRRLKKLSMVNCYNNYQQQNAEGQAEKVSTNKYFMDQVLQKNYLQLQYLMLDSIWDISKLPILKMPKLKTMELTGVQIKDISNFQEAQLYQLQKLFIKYMNIDSIPKFQLPAVKQISITEGQIKNTVNLQKSQFPSLGKLQLSVLSNDTQICLIQKINIKQLYIEGGKFKPNSVFQIHTLERLTFRGINCQNFPILIMQNLNQLNLQACSSVNLCNIKDSRLPKLKILQGNGFIQSQTPQVFPLLNLPSLQIITFSNCNFEEVLNLFESKLPALKQLNLQSNKLNQMKGLKFENLKQLNLSFNGLKQIKWLQQSVLPSLTQLCLMSNKFTEFPIIKMQKLKTIQLSQCEIKSLKNLSLCSLPQLKTLNVNGNKNKIQYYFSAKLPKITSINFNMDFLINIESLSSCQFHQLKQLRLYKLGVSITKLPKISFRSLENLNLTDCNISDINQLQNSQLPNLTKLTLSSTKVKSLPKMKFGKLKQLFCIGTKQLKKANKTLQSIQNIGQSQLPSLQLLKVQNNQIKVLPKLNLDRLVQLYVQNNQITDINQFIKSNLPSLKVLMIFDNNISVIPWGKNLHPFKLYLRQATLEKIDVLQDLSPVVTDLFINKTKLPEKVPPNLNFRNIYLLSLCETSLTYIDPFVRIPLLKINQLAILDNKIQSIPKIIAPRLKRLFLTRNCIKNVQEFMKSELNTVQMISLQQNDLQNLPDFPFQSVKEIFLGKNKIRDISCMSKYRYQRLKMLVANDNKIRKMPKLVAPQLQKIYLNQNQISQMQQMEGSQLKSLTLLQLQFNKIKDLSVFNKVKLDSLQNLYLMNNQIVKLCKLITVPLIYNLQFKKNPIKNLDQFLQFKTNVFYFSYSLDLNQSQKQPVKQKVQSTLSNSSVTYVQLNEP